MAGPIAPVVRRLSRLRTAERPPCRSPMTTGAKQKDRPPNYHVIARRAKPDVAIRISPVPWGTGGASHRREYGLPRPDGARNDVVIFGWSFYFGMVVIAAERAIPESPLQSCANVQENP